MGVKDHKKHAPKRIKVGVISVSSTRTEKTDESGSWIKKLAIKEGHDIIFYQVVPDDIYKIAETVKVAVFEQKVQALLLTGGTGISSKDVTIESVRPLFEKELTAFGPIFSQLSFEEIDSAALLSRATAGIIGSAIVFCMPGSLKACKLACKALIFPELGHLVKHIMEG
ncbi:MAG: molybdenum cofactor biosynthesis protein MoaB [Desulfobacterium sp.]|nr:molybdenum cofactor biosynthesis protein MoaB [Desulfobacterium sp.]MBU3949593.1 molybdenum cofactor biosynthesis protein MoaB [Pseudomonadota bacterium]MBU4036609.1 molybdenum cofactor biosynthesis protein MoaB [Pseudomonadota bacterium]